MSSPAPTSGVVTAVNNITSQMVTYAPAVLAGVQVAEQSTASGSDKKSAVLGGILAGAKIEEASTNPAVASISALIDLTVSILNSLGVFGHKSTTTTTAS